MCFPLGDLYQSPLLSQPCSQSTLDFSGLYRIRSSSVAPVGGGHDKGCELGVDTESRMLGGEGVRGVGGAQG